MFDAKSLLDEMLGAKMGNKVQSGLGRARDYAVKNPVATGAAASGLAAMLMGTKGGRALGGRALEIGGMALIAGLAYKAFRDTKKKSDDGGGERRREDDRDGYRRVDDRRDDYQRIDEGGSGPWGKDAGDRLGTDETLDANETLGSDETRRGGDRFDMDRYIDSKMNDGRGHSDGPASYERPPRDSGFEPLPDEEHDRSMALLTAMIAATKADGYIDKEERRAILNKLDEIPLEQEALDFVKAELQAPLDIDKVVKPARTPEIATEIYLASLLGIDPDHPAEKAYLAMLAARLELPDKLVRRLHDAAADARA